MNFVKIFNTTKARLLLMLGLALVFSTAVFVYVLYGVFQNNIQRKTTEVFKVFESTFVQVSHDNTSGLSMAMETLLQDKEIVKLFAEGNRAKLKEILLPIYLDSYKKKYRVAQFQFHTPPATSFLRLHKPLKFGDDLSAFRQTVIDANASKKRVVGLEVGRGGPGLRVVYPVEYEGKHIGSVEFGGSINWILDFLTKSLNIEYAIGIKEDVFKKAKRFTNEENDFVKNGLIYYKYSDRALLIASKKISVNDKIQYFSEGEKEYAITSVPLKDYKENNIGYITVYSDITKDKSEMKSSLRNNVVFVFLIGIVMFFIGNFMFGRTIEKPIIAIKDFANVLADGNYDAEIGIKSNERDMSALIKSLNIMKEKIKNAVHEAEEKANMAHEASEMAEKKNKEIATEREYLKRNTEIMLSAMEKFSQGDLSVTLKPEKEKDQIAALFNGFNLAVSQIRELILKLTQVVEITTRSSIEISSSTEELAAGASEQGAQASEVASSVEEMTRTILETSQGTSKASENAKEAGKKAREGVQKIDETKNGMEKIVQAAGTVGKAIGSLSGKTDQIGAIANVIDEIADQTNLLALNAAIEAARAGEQGRGFAVVADEVRKLAERTTKATKEIADTIKAIQRDANEANENMQNAEISVEEGKKKTDEVALVLSEILEAATRVEEEIEMLAAASEEESTAAMEISRSIETINNVTNESADGIQQVAHSAETLRSFTEQLSELVSKFIIDEPKEMSVNENDKKLLE
ncbi:MAG: hypothetical protein GXO87_11960 [Chlorobi bacterium]|nr:hypothetical protein [Chlorobiota bacterium]